MAPTHRQLSTDVIADIDDILTLKRLMFIELQHTVDKILYLQTQLFTTPTPNSQNNSALAAVQGAATLRKMGAQAMVPR